MVLVTNISYLELLNLRPKTLHITDLRLICVTVSESSRVLSLRLCLSFVVRVRPGHGFLYKADVDKQVIASIERRLHTYVICIWYIQTARSCILYIMWDLLGAYLIYHCFKLIYVFLLYINLFILRNWYFKISKVYQIQMFIKNYHII